MRGATVAWSRRRLQSRFRHPQSIAHGLAGGEHPKRGAGKTRYDNRAFGKTYRTLLELLANEDLLERQISRAIRGEVSSIRPTERFAGLVGSTDMNFADFARDPVQEVIILSRVTRTFSGETRRWTKRKKLIDYVDTASSNSYRSAVQELKRIPGPPMDCITPFLKPLRFGVTELEN